jgi:peptidoglycan/xylan/chitin deacetylase (PgdA/CDA1 family)
MKTILFTFDYELFLGLRSGSVKHCMIDPTRQLLELFRKYGFKAVFFVDTTHLYRLEEIAGQNPRAAADLELIRTQVLEILKKGHSVFPHIHAHWLDAIYQPDKNEWSLENTRYYQFSSLPSDKQELLFRHSVDLISGLAKNAGQTSPVDSYRAGGWSIQPFEHFSPFFRRFGIRHEWSVIPGKYHFSEAHNFDFRKAPADAPIYRFEEDPALRAEKGTFTEWTISTLTLTPLNKWLNFKVSGLLHRTGRMGPAKGSTVSAATHESGNIYETQGNTLVTASFEGLNPFTLRKYLSAIKKADYFQFISHPKLLSSYELGMADKLLKALKKENIQTDFRKVAQ